MGKANANNLPPIVKFFDKHKWRIILPLLFATFYWAYPRYNYIPIAVQQNLFVKSSVLNQSDLRIGIDKIISETLSDRYLLKLAEKYNLFSSENDESKKT